MARVDDYISMKQYPGGMVKTTALKNAIWTDRAQQMNTYQHFAVYFPDRLHIGSFLLNNDLYNIYAPVLPVRPVYRFERRWGEKWYSGDDKLSQSLSRSKSRLLELGLCNEWEYFVTLTLNPEWHDRYVGLVAGASHFCNSHF